MRYLTLNYIESSLNRGKAIEQFIGEITREGKQGIRFLQVRVHSSSYQLSIYDVEDIGSEEYLDVYSFSPIVEEDYDDPQRQIFNSLDETLAFTSSHLTASIDRWTNEGIVQDEYKDYITNKNA